MKKMKNMKTICLTLVALALIITLNVGNTLAYFTDFIVAEGGKTLDLGFSEAEIEENVITDGSNGSKVIKIQNTGAYPCFIRVKAFAGDKIDETLNYTPTDKWKLGKWNENTNQWESVGAEEKWDAEDNRYWYYYESVVPKAGYTDEIVVSFILPEGETGDKLNVIIIEESTPALYDNNGNPYADWDAKMNDPTTEIPSSVTEQK